MDNILKLLLGVLGVAGLIAMAAPTNMTVAPEPAPPAATETASAAPSNVDGQGLPPEQQSTQESFGDEFVIGEPTIDGKPIGFANQQSSNEQQQQEQNNAVPSYDPTTYGTNFNYDVPGVNSSPAVPDYSQPMPDAAALVASAQ